MEPPPPGSVTRLLEAIQAGDPTAERALAKLVYGYLRGKARQLMHRERPDPALQATALLHETWEMIFSPAVLQKAPNRNYLFAVATRAMRRWLVRHARQRRAQKRGYGRRRVPLDAVAAPCEEPHVDGIDLNEALEELATFHERASQIVTLRFFGRFTEAEVAERLDVSLSTVESDWRIARAWLRRLGKGWEGQE